MTELVHKAALTNDQGVPVALEVPGTPIAAGLDGAGAWACWYVTDGRRANVCTTATGGEAPPPEYRHLATFTDPGGFVVHAWTTGRAIR